MLDVQTDSEGQGRELFDSEEVYRLLWGEWKVFPVNLMYANVKLKSVTLVCVYIYIYIYIYMCVCVYIEIYALVLLYEASIYTFY